MKKKQLDLNEANVYVFASKKIYPEMPIGLHPVTCEECGAEGWGRYGIPKHVKILCVSCGAAEAVKMAREEPCIVMHLTDIIKEHKGEVRPDDFKR